MQKSTDPNDVYRKTILELEAEIESLQSKLDAREQLRIGSGSLQTLKTAWEKAVKDLPHDSENASSVITKLNEKLQVLETLMGVHLVDVKCEPHQPDPDSIPKILYTVEGNSYGIKFQLNLVVSQDENGVRIDSMEIDSLDSVNSDMGIIFDKVEEEKLIQGFCHIFVPYAKLRNERQKVLSKIEAKFGDLVHLPESVAGSQIDFGHHQQEDVTFQIIWNFKITSWHDMSHVVKLHVTARAAAMRNRILKKAPEMFDKMVLSYGPEMAIEEFIRSAVNGPMAS